ncbi:Putative ribonucleoprotein related-protein TROVE Domain [[Actinomadura] parvosata subsp. kistnae]|uniref:RNA-binding protein n=1 Tax=[Actinomadura] parvosata subsp. kistnae TaxID=1909395 RepID=A0A1U9ZXQ2_9ACTN|nr:TROVE domain-containing protein [Nonomuraea sp. ATCC 55076]AQZ62733.1 RNA-binding protein [Nonomuraea sp. ATCC 55076]SPL89489.1 Putative ribonucleoprotein related-protein TROVE Domain [Actinomadura parvosata subsp. kistnae]
MPKFNTAAARSAVTSPVKTTTATGRTHEGGADYARDTKSELFLLAITNMVGENTHYEPGADRDARFIKLVRAIAVEDFDWLTRFLPWLRSEANLRSAPIQAALEAVHARLASGIAGGNRQLVASVLQRADEPGEALAYWTSRYGRAVPKPVKRGIADAAARLYTERNLLKYDAESKGYRFGDVIDLVHPSPDPATPWQGALFQHALDRRHGRNNEIPETLAMLRRRAHLMSIPVTERRAIVTDGVADAVAATLADAGMTWEALAGWLQSPMDAAAWEAIIPSMGLMALTRNLRNFDEAGVSDIVAATVAARLANPDEVRKSRQFPFRFLSAYKHAPSLRWSYPLELALAHSLANVPALPGRSLILVDRSPSMWFQTFSKNASMAWADAAAVFGAALALRAAEADLVEFGIQNRRVDFGKNESVLKVIERFSQLDGTDIPSAVRAHLRPHHDRVVIITDEQSRPGWLPSNGHGYGGGREARIDDLIPPHVPLSMWNFGGYKHGAAPSGEGSRHTMGGLSDSAFKLIPILEARRSASWPF